MRLAVVILAMIVVISGLIFYFVIRRIRKQIDEMAEVLEDIKNGNGNRRILSETHEIVAPLAYEMNDIINEEEEATRRAKFEEFLQDYDLMSIVQIYSSELIEPERKKAIIELEKLGIDEDKIKNEVYPEIPLSEVLENVRMVKNYYAAVNS